MFEIVYIVLVLGEVAEIEVQMFNRRTDVEFGTKPSILPKCLLATVLVLLFQMG